MKEVLKKLIFCFICLLSLTALEARPANTLTDIPKKTVSANADVDISGLTTVSTIENAIKAGIDDANSSGGGVVTVVNTGVAFAGANATLTLAIPSGVTVNWNMEYSSVASFTGSMITLTGDGNFEVATNGSAEQHGGGAALNVSGTNATVTVYGAVSATSGDAIRVSGTNGKVIVDGDGTVSSSTTTNLHATIFVENGNTGQNVIIRGNGKVLANAANSGNFPYAIASYGDVLIEDNALVNAASNGVAIYANGSNSTVTVNGGTISTTGGNSGTAVNGSTICSFNVIINGGTVSATVGKAIHTRLQGASVIINGGTVSATDGFAVRNDQNALVEVNEGLVFAYGTDIGSVINAHSYSVSGGLVVAWDNSHTGPFPACYTSALSSNPEGAASWRNDGTTGGIKYANGTTDGFFPIDGVSVNLDTDYGLIFDATDGSLYLDVRKDHQVYADCKYTEGENVQWSGQAGALTLNGFEWITPASTALRMVNGSTTITLTGDNTFQSDSVANAYGMSSADEITITGSGSITAYGVTQAIDATLHLPIAYTSWTGTDAMSATNNSFPTVAFDNSTPSPYVKIQPLEAIEDMAINIIAPAVGENPDTNASGTGNFTIGHVTWSDTDDPFLGGKQYTATVVLTANPGFRFAASLNSATINGQDATVAENEGETVKLSFTFPETVSEPVEYITINISSNPNLLYSEGDTFDLTGLVVTLYYSSAPSIDVTPDKFGLYNITTDPADGTVLDMSSNGKPITVIYDNSATIRATTDDPLTVNPAPTVTAIAVVSQPAKLNYTYGDVLDLRNLAVQLTYSNASTKNVSFADFAALNISTNPANGTAVKGTQNGTPVKVTCNSYSANTSNLTVNPKGIIVSARGGSSVYGESPVNPGFFASGLVNGDTESSLSGLNNSFGISATTSAGTYALTIGGTLNNPNYIVSDKKSNTWVVNKAAGADVSGAPTLNMATTNSIIVNGVTIPVNPGDQTVEYAISTSDNLSDADLNALAWQSGLTFTGDFLENVVYYIYARSAENANYAAGTAQVSDSFSPQYTGIENVQASTLLKARISDGRLYVTGLTMGKPWAVYSLTGTRIYQSMAVGEKANIFLNVKGAYIVQSDNRTVKVVY